jgi:uncharacterized membrane protein
MDKGRLEAFSDGVIAVIITIMVLELKVPHGTDVAALLPSVPVFVTYVLSFVYTAIYWNNHHHLLHATERIDGRVMWANMHLLFWLSLVPFVTGWLGENLGASAPTLIYGIVILMAAIAYILLQAALVACNGPDSLVGRALGDDWKGKVSLACCVAAILAAFFFPWVSYALFVVVTGIWFVPDRRIERVALDESAPPPST